MKIVDCWSYQEMKKIVGNGEDWLQRQGNAFKEVAMIMMPGYNNSAVQ